HNLVDHRTDVYGLGVTLYELLTLHPAVEGEDRQELLRRIAEGEPRPPRAWDRSIPRDLETVLLKAMAREPQDRYATAKDMAEDLQRFLGSEPVRARRPTPGQRLSRWAWRRRGLVAAAAAFLLLGLAVLGGALVVVAGERDQKAGALSDRDRALERQKAALG